jgi:hypothetical protein
MKVRAGQIIEQHSDEGVEVSSSIHFGAQARLVLTGLFPSFILKLCS